MATETATTQANEAPQDAWARWQREHAELLERATGPQPVLLEATVRFVAVIAAHPILLRVAAYFLLHSGMGLTLVQVGRSLDAPIGPCTRCVRSRRTSCSTRSGPSWGATGNRGCTPSTPSSS